MDLERGLRERLVGELQEAFFCFEEVSVVHCFYEKIVLKVDVLAIPRDSDFRGVTIAFEVKSPNDPIDTSFWKRAIKQSSDYVLGKTQNPICVEGSHERRRINAVFIYPFIDSDFGYNEASIRAYFELGSYYKVGRAFREIQGRKRLILHVGNEVWRSDCGFTPMARGNLCGKRQVGCQKIDLSRLLDD